MLKLILETGYVDPELLEQISEEQREMLFQKLRDEQVRKWNEREAELAKKERGLPPKPSKQPKVGFLEGSDGQPWVWVMGEHPDDLSYEDLVRKREREREEQERQKTRKEAENLAKIEARLAVPVTTIDDTDGGGVGFARSESFMEPVEPDSPDIKQKTRENKVLSLWQKAVDKRETLIQNMSEEERASYEKRRANEIYESMLRTQELAKQRAADVVLEVMARWRQSEEKARAIERERRESIRRAKEKAKTEGVDESILATIPEEKKKELTRKISERSLKKSQAQNKVEDFTKKSISKIKTIWHQSSTSTTKPKTMEQAMKWFQEIELPKAVGREMDGSISLWFHGTTTKAMAESLLYPKPAGMYLVRLSNKIWGYSISVKTHTNVKHYMVDVTTPGVYKFIGKYQPEFTTLSDLLSYYKVNPITWKGQEVLLLACEQPKEYLEDTKKLFEDIEDDEATQL